MTRFNNKEEYEKWKANKLKAKEPKLEDINQDNDKRKANEPPKTSGVNKKSIRILALVLTIFISITFLYLHLTQPKRVAEKYLKATQLYDIEALVELSSTISDGQILINLIKWNFIKEARSSKKKELLDLSKDSYERELQLYLDFIKKSNASDKISSEMKDLFGFNSHEDWVAHNIEYREAFEENGSYYYYSK